MTNFTKKAQATAKVAIGKGQIAVSRKGRSQFGGTLSNEARLDLARMGTKALMQGTVDTNRLKRAQTTDEGQ